MWHHPIHAQAATHNDQKQRLAMILGIKCYSKKLPNILGQVLPRLVYQTKHLLKSVHNHASMTHHHEFGRVHRFRRVLQALHDWSDSRKLDEGCRKYLIEIPP